MPINTESFNVESLKKVMKFKKISINSLGIKLAEIKGIQPESGIRQLRRNMNTGSMQKQTILALANYLQVPVEWFDTDYDADQITSEDIENWNSMFPLWNKEITYNVSQNETDELFRKLFESQGYELLKFTDGKYRFIGKLSGYSEEGHIGESITESQYNRLVQSVLKAVNDCASELDAQLLKEEGKDNGVH